MPKQKTVAEGRPSRAKYPPRPPGKCTACGDTFPLTLEFFQPLKNKRIGWEGLSSECRSCRNARFRAFYADNREKQIARAVDYIKAKPEAKRSRDMVRYARRSKHIGAPAWADHRKIETIYAIATFLTKHTGVEYQVDHVYPLFGKTSCGLHVHENLRVITAAANQAKGNRVAIV